MGMVFTRKNKIIFGIGVFICSIALVIVSLSLFLGIKMKRKLLNEFNEFTASSQCKRLRKWVNTNNNIGIIHIKEQNAIDISVCFSYQHFDDLFKCCKIFLDKNKENQKKILESVNVDDLVAKIYNIVMFPYLFSIDRLKKFWKCYDPSILTKLGIFLSGGLSEFNFINKTISLLEGFTKNGEGSYETFEMKKNSVKVSMSYCSDSAKKVEEISFKSKKESMDFMIFLLGKANIFDKKNIIDTINFISCNSFGKNEVLEIIKNVSDTLARPNIDQLITKYISDSENFKKMLKDFFETVKDQEIDVKKISKEFEGIIWILIDKIIDAVLNQSGSIIKYLDDAIDNLKDIDKILNHPFILNLPSAFLNRIKIFMIETEKKTTSELLNLIKEFLKACKKKYILIKSEGNKASSNFKMIFDLFKSQLLEKFLENEEYIKYIINVVLMFDDTTPSDDENIAKIHTKLLGDLCLSGVRMILTILYD
ncbi:hypothetical protein LUQ84_002580 [Hamiltosporidium tvaerminnensis]|nr:hypothetical protein LUQ84_002580 [Hamiltosporidium tvaerminnensis]